MCRCCLLFNIIVTKSLSLQINSLSNVLRTHHRCIIIVIHAPTYYPRTNQHEQIKTFNIPKLMDMINESITFLFPFYAFYCPDFFLNFNYLFYISNMLSIYNKICNDAITVRHYHPMPTDWVLQWHHWCTVYYLPHGFTHRSNGTGVGRFSRTCSTNSFCVRPQYLTETMIYSQLFDTTVANRRRQQNSHIHKHELSG